MLTETLGEATKTDRGEEIDGESRVARIVAREETGEIDGHVLVVEALVEGTEAQVLCQLLEEGGGGEEVRRVRS